MKKAIYSILIIAMAAAITAAQGFGDRNRPAGAGSFNIFVKVILPDGKPASGVSVSMSSADVSSSGSGTTDSEGVYTFSGVSAGNFHFIAKLEGYAAENENLTIERDASSSQAYNVLIHFRLPGQKKGDVYSANPMFKDVSKDALERFKKGMEKSQKNDNKAAITLFDEAIAMYPQFAAAYLEKGSAHLKIEEYDKAIAAFAKAVEIKPDYYEAKYSIGYARFLMKDYEVAAAVFGDILQKKKDDPQVFMYIGMCLVHMNRIDQAEYALKQAVTLKGGENLALAHRSLGGIYIQKKKNAEAIGELEKYLELVPKAPDADKLKQTITDLKKQG
jgi:tetratricopeptide (TPR) repeat protein